MSETNLFDRSVYSQRRQELADSLGSGIALFLGLEHSSINYEDNWYPFRQDSSFLYYFGINQPGLAALVDLATGRSTLFGDDVSVEDMVWTGPVPPLAEQAERVGIDSVESRSQLEGQLNRRAAESIHRLPAYREQTRAWMRELGLKQPHSDALVRSIISQRERKSDEEVEEIEKAVTVSTRMHEAALRAARPGLFEYEVVAKMLQEVSAAGMTTAFPIIATVRGETLHNHSHHRRLESGQLFLSDAGAETSMGYAGDLSRTGPVDRTFTTQQKDVYTICLAAHEAAKEAVGPGVPFLEVHKTACLHLVRGLIDLGLMQGDPDEAVRTGAHALFFPCGTGHMMGLDVHDMEGLGEDLVGYSQAIKRNPQFGLKSLRLAKELQPGFVLTVEPGLYFIPGLIDQWEAEGHCADFIRYDRLPSFRSLGGMRSEDNLLVTDAGHRVLGPPLPTEIEEIEALKAAP